MLLLAAGAAAVGFELARAPAVRPGPRSAGHPSAQDLGPGDLSRSGLPDAEAVAGAALAGSGAPTIPGYPWAGTGDFGYAAGTGPVRGSVGSVRRYQVAVERGTGQRAAGFAVQVDAILGDPRGWTQDGLRFQRVPSGARADFTIYLASPATSAAMCAVGGLYTEEYTSCRLPGRVIINLARWLDAVPGYAAPIDVYRAYALNHETGHELGYGHEACPAPGRPAPVMQQQTYGLQRCVANGWPYVDGVRYTGPPVP